MELLKKATTDRRNKHRFAMQREIRYKTAEDGVVVAAGNGQTVNIGSGGVAFVADNSMQTGSFVELSISWPVLLDESCPMRLIVFGRVLRATGKKAVCSIDKYEFRTQSRMLQAVPAPRTDGMLQRWSDGVRKGTLRTNLARA
jgi:hypothetical protein